jgi:uncharacterized phiE125 gp8 family phage protein
MACWIGGGIMIPSLFVPLFGQASADSGAWLTLAEAREHLRTEPGVEEDLITSNIAAVRRLIERETWHYPTQAVRTFRFQNFAGGQQRTQRLIVPALPVAAVQSVTYVDTAGAVQTLDPSLWRVGDYFGLVSVCPAPGATWPDVAAQDGAVSVVALCGYASAADVPEDLKLFARLMLGHYFANREAVIVGGAASVLPMAADYLINDYRPRLLH